MNNPEIETILRNAPRPGAPSHLKEKLLAEASNSLRQSPNRFVSSHSAAGWFRRWWPALAPATVSLACAVVLTAQRMEINDLKRSLETLSPAAAVSQPTQGATGLSAQPSSQNSESAGQEDELTRLKQLAAQLSVEIAGLEQMLAENEKLRQQIAAASANKLSNDEIAALDQAKERALRIHCVNNLKQIGLAARMWALDNGDVYPTNFLCMSNELSTPKILVCPADTNRVSAQTFSSFTDANCSYEFFSGSDKEPDQVLTRCPIHGSIGLCDGSVQMSLAKDHPERLFEKDGKPYLKRNP